nr:DUF3107 domain-containing protein [Acidimicrobiia bacterium]
MDRLLRRCRPGRIGRHRRGHRPEHERACHQRVHRPSERRYRQPTQGVPGSRQPRHGVDGRRERHPPDEGQPSETGEGGQHQLEVGGGEPGAEVLPVDGHAVQAPQPQQRRAGGGRACHPGQGDEPRAHGIEVTRRWTAMEGERRGCHKIVGHVQRSSPRMKARIGVADSSKVIEIEVEDAEKFRAQVEEAFASEETDVYWFTDVKNRSIGVPVNRIAFVEIDPDEPRKVGFAPGT